MSGLFSCLSYKGCCGSSNAVVEDNNQPPELSLRNSSSPEKVPLVSRNDSANSVRVSEADEANAIEESTHPKPLTYQKDNAIDEVGSQFSEVSSDTNCRNQIIANQSNLNIGSSNSSVTYNENKNDNDEFEIQTVNPIAGSLPKETENAMEETNSQTSEVNPEDESIVAEPKTSEEDSNDNQDRLYSDEEKSQNGVEETKRIDVDKIDLESKSNVDETDDSIEDNTYLSGTDANADPYKNSNDIENPIASTSKEDSNYSLGNNDDIDSIQSSQNGKNQHKGGVEEAKRTDVGIVELKEVTEITPANSLKDSTENGFFSSPLNNISFYGENSFHEHTDDNEFQNTTSNFNLVFSPRVKSIIEEEKHTDESFELINSHTIQENIDEKEHNPAADPVINEESNYETNQDNGQDEGRQPSILELFKHSKENRETRYTAAKNIKTNRLDASNITVASFKQKSTSSSNSSRSGTPPYHESF